MCLAGENHATTLLVREVALERCWLGVDTESGERYFAAVTISEDGLHRSEPIALSAGCPTLRDGSVLAVYYEEGEGSAIRAMRFRVHKNGIQKLRW